MCLHKPQFGASTPASVCIPALGSGSVPKADVLIGEVWLNAAALAKQNSLFVHLAIPRVDLSVRALVDSGSTHSFVDEDFVDAYELKHIPTDPMCLRLFNGTSNSVITEACDLALKHSCGTVTTTKLLCTRLNGELQVVLGHDWLCTHNPRIDWADNTVTFQPSKLKSESPRVHALNLNTAHASCGVAKETPPSICLISATAFAQAQRAVGAQVFQMSLSDVIAAQCLQAKELLPVDIPRLPLEYREFADVFSEESSKNLAPHCPYDLKIDLEPGMEPRPGPVTILLVT
jgi:hypothetical protein